MTYTEAAAIRFRTKKPIRGDSGEIRPAGSDVVLVELLDEKKNVWLVEVRVPNPSLLGGASYDLAQVELSDLLSLD